MFATGFQSNMNFLNVAYSQNKMIQPVPKKEDVITEKVKFIYILYTQLNILNHQILTHLAGIESYPVFLKI